MKDRKSGWAKRHCRFASDNREKRDPQMPGKISAFTLVEVTMAIGVIAIGMMGIMALLPIGFQATKRAVGDNYSSELADQFLNLVAMQCKAYSSDDGGATVDGWGDWITDDAASGSPELIPEAKADTSDLNSVSPGDKLLDGIEGIYKADQAKGLYYVDAKSGASAESVTDFSAVMALWKEEIPYKYDSNADGKIDLTDTSAAIPYENAVRLYLEISWPASIPYKQRTKRYYVRDVFNPVERAGTP